MMKIIIFLMSLFSTTFVAGLNSQAAIRIEYTINLMQPQNHSMQVKIDISGIEQSFFHLKLHDSVDANSLLLSFTAKNESGTILNVIDIDGPKKGTDKEIILNGSKNIQIQYELNQTLPTEILIGTNYATILFSKTIYKPVITEGIISGINLELQVPPGWKVLTDLTQISETQYRLDSLDDIMDEQWGVTRSSMIVAGKMSIRDKSFDDIAMRIAIFDNVLEDGFPITFDRFEQVCINIWRFYTKFYGGTISKNPIIALTPSKSGQNYGKNILAQSYMGISPDGSKYEVYYPWNLTHHINHTWWINALSIDPNASPYYYAIKEGFNGYINLLSMEYANLWEDRAQAWHWLNPEVIMHSAIIPELYFGNFIDYRDNDFGTTKDMQISGSGGYVKPTKVIPFARILDYKIQFASNKSKNLSDLFIRFFFRNGGYWFNPGYRVNCNELLYTLNELTNRDYTVFFNKYVYGLALIPYEAYYKYEVGLIEISQGNIVEANRMISEARQLAIGAGEMDLVIECDRAMGKRSKNIMGWIMLLLE